MSNRFEWVYGLIVPVIVVIVTAWRIRADARESRRTIRVNGREVDLH